MRARRLARYAIPAAVAAAAIAGAFVIVARRGGPPVQRPFTARGVYVVDDAVKIGRDGRLFTHRVLDGYAGDNPAWDGAAVTLAGARGEVVAFQVIVAAGEVVLPEVTAALAIEPARADLFRQWYTRVDRISESPALSTGVGWYPDALIPAGLPGDGLPVDVPAGQVQGIWVDVAIPRDAPAGRHAGELRVTSAGTELARYPVALEVYDFALPARPALVWRVGYGGFGEYLDERGLTEYDRVTGEEGADFRARERQLVELVTGYGLVPTTHYSSPIPQHEGQGAGLRLRWEGFDRRFAPYLDPPSIAAFALPVNLQSYGGWPTGTHGAAEELDAAALEAALRQTIAHWRDRGWPLARSFIYLADEPEPPRYETIDRACEVIRRVSSDVPVTMALYDRIANEGRALVDRFAGCVTTWALAGDYADLPIVRERQAAGDRVEIYQGSEPFLGSEALDADGLSLITWPWIAWRYRVDGLFLYNIVEWSYFRLDDTPRPWGDRPRDIWTNPMNQSWVTNSHGVLVYPGDDRGVRGVLPSIRLAQARRGMQDYAYLSLAVARGHAERAEAAARALIPRALSEAADGLGGDHFGLGHWERDPRRWAAQRRALADAIAGR